MADPLTAPERKLQARILKERRFLLASSSWPGGIPEAVLKAGDEPAGSAGVPTPVGQGQAVTIGRRGERSDYERWEQANVVRGEAKGTVSAYAYARLGDVTFTWGEGNAKHVLMDLWFQLDTDPPVPGTRFDISLDIGT